jgi:PAS domain S-box-containing protein
VVLTIAIFIISVISLLSGWQTIFQNLFYFPIILACVYYVKRGFVFSVLLACGYFVLMGCFSQDFVMLEGAFVRVLIFILVAGVITYLSMIRIRAEDTLYESKRQLDAMAANIPGVVYRYYVNPDGTTGFDYISGRSRQILGLENDNFTFFDRFTEGIVPEERKRFLSSVQHAISTKTLWEFDSQYAKPSGEKIWISAISSPVMEKDQLIFDGVIFDNTDRKEADEFIRLLAHISDDAPASITVHDNEGNFLYANEETLRLHGYTREEFLAKNLHEIDVPESEQLIAERMQKIRDAGSAEFDVQHFRKDGSILPLHLNAKPVDWRGRKVLLSIATDISDRKIAEEILKESEDRFRAISEYSHNAICIIDEHAKILWVNDKMLALGGYSREQVYAVESFVGFIAPESIEFVVSNFSKVLAGEPYEHHYNFYIIRADGEKRLCEKYMMDVVDTHGKRNLIISMLDITERKRADEALRGSDARQRAMIANITDVIAIIDTQGIIRYKSENIEKIFGWKPEELVGLSFRETAHPEDVEQITHVFLKLIEDENASTTIEYRYKLKDGSFHTIHLTAKNLIHDPNINGVLVNYHDITEHKLAKDTLLNVNQKLNVLSQLTRKDLANQIFVLNSYLELAKHQLAGQDLIIETVQKGVRAIQSIHETIEYSKDYQDMGAKPPKWQNVKMALLFGLSHISIGNIQHSLETENLEIFADPLLEKVCQRLFENSVKHGDHVTLIRVWHTTTPAGVTIFFEDNGIGISEEKKEQIFLRDESTGRASMRSLIFVREILDITGITIRETGEPGKGARFEMMVQKGAWRMRKEDGV